MKNLLKIVFSFMMIIVPFKFFGNQPDRLLYKLIADKSKILSKRYSVDIMGTNVGMSNNVVRMLGATFKCENISSKEQGRLLVIIGAKEFLNAINADEKIRPYLVKYPLTIDNIEVTLFFSEIQPFDKDGNQLRLVSIEQGIVYFKYENKIPTRSYSKIEEEKFEEAKK